MTAQDRPGRPAGHELDPSATGQGNGPQRRRMTPGQRRHVDGLRLCLRCKGHGRYRGASGALVDPCTGCDGTGRTW